MPAKKRGPKQVSDTHKAAMAQGRNESRAVAAYLEALRASKPKRGRKRTSESIERRLGVIDTELATASAIEELLLRQEQRSLLSELAGMEDQQSIDDVEAAFVEIAKSYSERKGIEYMTWRDLGVSAKVLKQAGVTR
jgi:hypothetical protein